MRLDHLLVERGLAESGAKAQALILAGQVAAEGLQKLKPGLLVAAEQPLALIRPLKYVSRGGEKLEGALKDFGVSPAGRDCLDVGASTGGFTDCLLQNGAKRVFAVDVGSAQLHAKLKADPRVTSREGLHVLRLSAADLPFVPSLVVIDVAFISLEKVLPHVAGLVPAGTEILALVKPQFEAGPKDAPKGVVRDPKVRERVLAKIEAGLGGWGLALKGRTTSPLKGPKGNVEFFVHGVKV